MQRKLGAVALLFFLSLNADARPGVNQTSRTSQVCGVCLELDNETLPDKHYFPAKEQNDGEGGASVALFPHEDPISISAQIWTTESAHSRADASDGAALAPEGSREESPPKHGEPAIDHNDFSATEWAWGGVRECSRGPEGKIPAGCHTAPYNNLLCNSHYDDCDDELFALAVNAVMNADAKALRNMMEHSGRATVVLNKKRSAIQLVGCTGDIIGNLPIDSSLLRALQ